MAESLSREQLEAIFARREVSKEQREAMSEMQREQHAMFSAMLKDLRYPVTKENPDGTGGDIVDVSYMAAVVAYHLVRCGWRPQVDKRVIKARKVVGRGVPTNAVEWVGMDEPDDPLADIQNMTMSQVAQLSPQARAEAIRRLQPNVTPDIPMPESNWQLTPNLRITDAPRDPFVDSEAG